MQFFPALIAALLLIITNAAICRACTDDSWLLYKKEFEKQYASPEEDQRRRTIFCDNLKMIHDHNEKYRRGEVTFAMGVNRFVDWTHDDFLRWMRGVDGTLLGRPRTISVI